MLKPTQYFIELRGRKCDCCHRYMESLQRHHWLFHRMRGFPMLDNERNIGLVCEECHQSGKVNAYESRVAFWKLQNTRYNGMVDWWLSIPLIKKEAFDDERLMEYCKSKLAIPASPVLQS